MMMAIGIGLVIVAAGAVAWLLFTVGRGFDQEPGGRNDDD